MAKFRKGGSRQMAALSTASLPDIVFMLLFFFMSVTTMKETDYKVKIKLPTATEVKKLEKKSGFQLKFNMKIFLTACIEFNGGTYD